MKLNSKYLKELILEVIDEATRRDFLKGAAGIAGLAALGKGLYDLYDDEDDELVVPDVKDEEDEPQRMVKISSPRFKQRDTGEAELIKPNPELPISKEGEWKEPKAPYATQQGKYALDQLRITPDNLEYYSVAPASSNTGDGYVYVDMAMLYDMLEQNPQLEETLDVGQAFFNDWSLKRHYKYVFGQLAFWGTFKDPENRQSRQMAPSFRTATGKGETIRNVILPLAWTFSLEYWLERFLNLESRLQQYPEHRKNILMEAELTIEEYYEMKTRYRDVIDRVSDPSIVTNPNYKPEEK